MTLKERTAAISLAASLILAAAKLAVGVAIGSLALITDALHSCVDFLATGVTWMAVRVADRPADASHPYGHGKFENLAALGEATLLLLLGGGVMVEAVGRIAAAEPPPPLSLIAVAVLLVEIVVNAWRARDLAARRPADAERGAGGGFAAFRLRRLLLACRARRLRPDRVRLLVGGCGAAIAVAAIIAVLALRLVIHTINALVDRAPEGVADLIATRTLATPGVLGVSNVRVRSVGPGISSRRPSRCRARSASSRQRTWKPRRRARSAPSSQTPT